MLTIKQGDSYGILLNLSQDGQVLVPDMVNDIEVCIGETLRYSAVDGGVKFDTNTNKWYIWPTQDETFSLEEGTHKVEIRVKYKNNTKTNVKGYDLLDKVKVRGSVSREVL